MTTTAENRLQPCPLCGTANKFNCEIEPLNDAETDNLVAEISHADACVAAFRSPDRHIPTEQISEGLVFKLIDALKRSDDKLQVFIGEHEDPGADAFAVVHCNNLLLSNLKIEP